MKTHFGYHGYVFFFNGPSIMKNEFQRVFPCSGGPLMLIYNRTWQIIGITSYGEGCARAHRPGSFRIQSKPDVCLTF